MAQSSDGGAGFRLELFDDGSVIGKGGACPEQAARRGYHNETPAANNGRKDATACHNRIQWTFLLH